MDFDSHRALISLYKSDKQRVVIRKAVQVGISEFLIVKAISKLYEGWSILYSLPIENLRNTFVANRIDRVIEMVPFYRQGLKDAVGDSDQVGMKHFWNGTIKFVGSNAPSSFREYPADMVIIDELDISNQDNLKLAEDRLQASRHKYFWQVGNPTIPDYGIDAEYQKSDQKQWFVRCHACNEWQTLDFFRNVVRQVDEGRYEPMHTTGDDIQTVCNGCYAIIDRLQAGEWIASYEDRDISGYHFSQLFSPTVTLNELWESFQAGLTNATARQVFYNSRLGLPYVGTGDKLTAAILQAKCVDDYLMPSTAKDCTAGIDVNWPQLHVRISDYPQPTIRRAVFIGTVYSFSELANLLNRYDVKFACIDAAPERHKVAEHQKSNPVVWAVQYASGEITEFWRVKPDEKLITVDRTQSIDAMVSEILSGRNRLPKDFRTLDGGRYVEQIEAPTRRLDTSKNPPRYLWDEGMKADHHFHADNYDCLAMRIRNELKAPEPKLWRLTI